eukprot:Selendium_serpulae@DN6082_c1_g1_i4.p3
MKDIEEQLGGEDDDDDDDDDDEDDDDDDDDLEEKDKTAAMKESADAVFIDSWTPSYLNEMCDLQTIEREIERKERGEKPIHERMLNLATPNPVAKDEAEDESDDSGSFSGTDEDGDTGTSTEDDDDVELRKKKDPYGGLTAKEWKRKVKTENRERRKTKVKKHVKKKYRSKAANK